MTEKASAIIVAIDGPAASGKSSTAKAVAHELGYRYLDSGAFYRAVTLAVLERGLPPATWDALTADDLRSFNLEARSGDSGYRLLFDGTEVGDRIRSAAVNAHVSRIAALPAVRDWLLGALRDAGRERGLVADGRDIGTVVFPDAELKLFLVCEPEERALRRLRQQGIETPDPLLLQEEARRLVERDQQDESRGAAPLRRAPDAVVLDTTQLAFDAQVRAITGLARARIGA